jgi:hypothetical protein
MRDFELAKKLQPYHTEGCHGDETGECASDCDWLERVHNTFLVLMGIRVTERAACEAICRECGSARASDRIQDRAKDDDKR